MVCNTRREESFWSPSLRVHIAVEVMQTGNGDNNTVYQTSVPFLTIFLISLSFVKLMTQIAELKMSQKQDRLQFKKKKKTDSPLNLNFK